MREAARQEQEKTDREAAQRAADQEHSAQVQQQYEQAIAQLPPPYSQSLFSELGGQIGPDMSVTTRLGNLSWKTKRIGGGCIRY